MLTGKDSGGGSGLGPRPGVGLGPASGEGRRRFGATAAAVLALPLVGLGVLLWLLPTVPARIPSHWGFSGRPDGWSDPVSGPVAGAALALLAVLVVLLGLPRLKDPFGARVLAGLCAFVPAAISTLAVLTLVDQSTRFVAVPNPDAPLPDLVLPVALLLSLLAGVVAAAAVPTVPDVPARTGPPAGAPRVPGGPAATGSGLRWEGRVQARGGLVFAIVPTLVVLGIGVAGVVAGAGPGLLVGLLGLMVVVDLLVAGMLFVRVVVDADGVRAGTSLPVLRDVRRLQVRVPLATIEQARAVDVHPLREFGGLGYRVGTGGRSGFVLRAGEALEVVRGNGSAFVVTVDGARDAAAVVNTLLDARARG